MTTTNESVRASFVERFGEIAAAVIENAAEDHNNEVHGNKGADPFKWALLICIGYDCFTLHDGVKDLKLEEVKDWALKHGKLATHDGDCDFLFLMTGGYKEWINNDDMEQEATA
jgi:hypothetical protein